jgi:uncharacterized MAPEG superfamily protein
MLTASIIYALLAATLLPILCAFFAKVKTGFDLKKNLDPRAALATGAEQHVLVARLLAAEKNHWEGLPFFYMSVLLALIMIVPAAATAKLAWGYVLFRVLYTLCYALGFGVLRSIVWTLGVIDLLILIKLCLSIL